MAGPVADPYAGMAAITARTSRVRIGVLLAALARRRPWKFAREMATLDVFLPTPIQQPRAPIWIRGRWPATRRSITPARIKPATELRSDVVLEGQSDGQDRHELFGEP
jgi:hypothetical protein